MSAYFTEMDRRNERRTCFLNMEMAAAPNPRLTHVLLVEDVHINAIVIKALFANDPHISIEIATTGAKAKEQLADQHFELILLDINLPDMTGYEVLQWFRSAFPEKQTPVVGVSADAPPQQADKALVAGFDAYLTKPIDFEKLKKIVYDLIAGDGFGNLNR